MVFTTLVTAVGNLTANPELRSMQSGKAVANFTIAATPRTFDRDAKEWKDGEPVFLRCSVFDEMAENVAHSLSKGSRVMVQGTLKQSNYQDREGNKRSSLDLIVDEIGVTLRYHTAIPEKRGRNLPSPEKSSSQDDGWVTVDDDETPF